MLGEFACIGLSIYFVGKIRRLTRRDPSPSPSSTRPAYVPPPEAPLDYGRLAKADKAAILLMSLPAEVTAQVFVALGPRAVQDITIYISKLPQIPEWARAQVLREFLVFVGELGVLPQQELHSAPPQEVMLFVAGKVPEVVAKILHNTWLAGP